MKRHFLHAIIALFLVLALTQSLGPTSPSGFGQNASAGPPATPTPVPTKTKPDTAVPETGSTPRIQSPVTYPAGAGAMRAGFDSLTLNPNDDGSTGLVNIGFPINFFGITYTQLYVNNNGNVTFSGSLGTYTPFNIKTAGEVIIAPFFADVDTRAAGQPTQYGPGAVDTHNAFGVSWRNVDYYQSNSAHVNRNYFQLVLVDRSDLGAGDFDIEFNYDQIQWEAGTASGSGDNGLGGSAARAGYSNGYQAVYEITGSGVNGAFLDSNPDTGLALHSFNSDLVGRYVFQVRGGYTPPALTTDTSTLNVGTSINTPITLQNVPAVGLGSYSAVLHYDPAVATVVSVGDGDAPFGAPTTATIDNTAGTVTLADSQIGSTPSGNIVLATLNIQAIGNGSFTLGATGVNLTEAGGAPISNIVAPGVVTVTTPEVRTGQGTVLVGSSVDIPVSVLGLANQSLKAYDITIYFDNNKVNVNSVTGGAAPFNSPTSTIDNAAGQVTLGQTAGEGYPTGNVLVAHLNVQGIAEGSGDLSIEVTSLLNGNSVSIPHTTNPEPVSVTAALVLTRIAVTPGNTTVAIDGSQTFTAQGFDQYDNPMTGLTFGWTCTTSDAGSINSASGVFTAGTVAGNFANVIRATSGTVYGTASVTVPAGSLHHMVVSPANPEIPSGDSLTFTAATYDQYDNLRNGDPIAWSVTNADAGSIDASTGEFTASTVAGTYDNVIVATSGVVTGTTSVIVFHVRLPGDVNDDGSVDLLDLAAVAAAFNSLPGYQNWNGDADLNLDETVNVFDLVVVGLNFGAHA